MLVDYSDFGNSFAPNNRASIKFGHLGGDCDLDPDTALIVNFLELLQSSGDQVVSVGLTVVMLYVRKSSCSAKASDDRVGDKSTGVNCPAVIGIETDLFGRWFVHDGPLLQIGGRAEFADRHRSVGVFRGWRIRRRKEVESVVFRTPHLARAASQDSES